MSAIAPVWAVVRDKARPYTRHGAALIAGLAITFTQAHGTLVGVSWFTVSIIMSLVLRDGPKDILNQLAWWAGVIVTGATTLGLLIGRMSSSSALSLAIALAAFETARAFARKDRLWGWLTGLLVVALTIVYTFVDRDSVMVAGIIGVWAIVAGVFGLISIVDARLTRDGKPGVPGMAKVYSTLGESRDAKR